MTAGIFALIGVVLGGAVTGTVQLTLERARDRAATRAAARLVWQEFAQNHARVAAARRHGEEVRGILTEIAGPMWAEHRALLARTLSDEDWGRATMAWMLLDASRVIGEPERGPLTDVEMATIAAAADATELAMTALGRRALPSQKTDPADALARAREALDLQPPSD